MIIIIITKNNPKQSIDLTIALTKFGKDVKYFSLKCPETKEGLQAINPINTHTKFGKDRINTCPGNDRKPDVGRQKKHK